MIFVTLGNQNFEFSRLLRKVEELVQKEVIKSDVVAQVGHTSFQSSIIEIIDFLNKDEFERYILMADYVISHGGTGSIISCLKHNKKVIAAPRLKKYNEHIDNHQLEIITAFSKKKLIIALDEEFIDFEAKLLELKTISVNKFISNNSDFNKDLIKIIESI